MGCLEILSVFSLGAEEFAGLNVAKRPKGMVLDLGVRVLKLVCSISIEIYNIL